MLTRVLAAWRALCLLLCLTLAFGTTGFLHAAPTPEREARAAYLAAGFALSDLCGTLDETADTEPCFACTLTGPLQLAGAGGGLQDLPLCGTALSFAPGAQVAVRSVFDPARATRGPPLVRI